MTYSVEVVTGALPCSLGEGPHWDATEGVLYYVDIPQGRVLRYDPRNNNTSYVNVSEANFLWMISEFTRNSWDGKVIATVQSLNFLCCVSKGTVCSRSVASLGGRLRRRRYTATHTMRVWIKG